VPSLVAITVVPKFVSSAPATPKESTVHDPSTRSPSRHQSASLYLALNRFWIVAPRSFGSTRVDFLNH
jgi:hypothetical protein